MTDEVYEHLVFDGAHVPLATLPGMAERTVSISSGGKTFSFTGWKVGWVSGPGAAGGRRAGGQAVPHLHLGRPLPVRHRARALPLGPAVINGFGRELAGQARPVLRRVGAGSASPCTARRRPTSPPPTSRAWPRAWTRTPSAGPCPQRCGVVAIPSSVFYDPGDPVAGRTLVRWAFCKRTEVLEEALARLAAWG